MLKNYIEKFNNLLKERVLQYFLLFIVTIILLIWKIPGELKYFHFLFVFLFYASFIIPSILLIKKSKALKIFQLILMMFLSLEVVFGILNFKRINQFFLISNSDITKKNKRVNTPFGIKTRLYYIKKRSVEILNGDTLYDVFYSFDEYGRRISDDEASINNSTKKNSNEKHAIFLGSSITFGEGMMYGSTFPFIFEREHPDFKSYNYGFQNFGPNQICLLFDEGINTINNYNIPEDSGVCIYTFTDDHLNSVYGGSKYLYYGEATPDVFINNSNLLCKKLSYIQKHIAWFLNNSEIMKFFDIKFTYPKQKKFYKRFADIINYIAGKYWNNKPHGEFYVSLYPGLSYDKSWIEFLDKKIKVLNIPIPNDVENKFSSDNYGYKRPAKELNSFYGNEISKLVFKK